MLWYQKVRFENTYYVAENHYFITNNLSGYIIHMLCYKKIRFENYNIISPETIKVRS